MPIRVLAFLLLCPLGASTAHAQFRVSNPAPGEDFHVELSLMFWTPTPELKIQTGALAALGTSDVDFVREFAIVDQRFNDFQGVLRAGRKHKIRISHVLMQYDEQAVLQRAIAFGGRTFPVAVPATAYLQWDMWRFGYEWDFVAADRGVVGLITELKYNKVTAELAATGLGAELTEVTAPIPALGILARAYPHRNVAVTAEFTGFKMPGFIGDRIGDAVGGNAFDAKLYDFDIYGTLNFGRHVGVQGGYRSLTADYTVDDDSGDLKMKGTYFGAVVRF